MVKQIVQAALVKGVARRMVEVAKAAVVRGAAGEQGIKVLCLIRHSISI
jgi:hypothetical protein